MSLNAVSSAAQHKLGPVVFKRMELAPPPYGHSVGSILLVVLGLLSCGAGVLMPLTGGDFVAGMVLVVLGLPFLAVGGFFLLQRARLRCALTVHAQGLVISRKDLDTVIPYSQVQDFSLTEKEQLNNGRHAGMLRLLDLRWVEGKTRLSQFAKVGQQDTFAPVLGTLLNELANVAEARLKTGNPLRGKGWVLDSHGLDVGGQGALRLSELAGVGNFENRVSFWRVGEELPYFSVPENSPNARVLGVVARRQLSDRERPMAGPLGRVLFQRKMRTASKVFCWALAVGLFLFGGAMGIGLGSDGSWLGALLALGLSWGFGVVLAINTFSDFRVHELGVTRKSLGQHTLRYSEIVSFQFGATRHYYNGAYTGTTVNMRFTPAPGAKPITHNQTVRGNDSDLDSLREQVAAMVAHHLLARLRRGEDVQWGPTARFTPRGLVVRASKLFGKGEERLAPYDAGLRYTIEQGSFKLFIGNEGKAAMTVACAADNFYPGLKILGELCSREARAPQAAG